MDQNFPISFKVEKDGDQFHAWCPELVGCHTHGKTVGEALEHLKDAVQLFLDTVIEEEITRQSAEMLDEA
ncbi:MAG: type II toxin-antitoxin system HicB family antitoxin [Cyclobacteriaceae bacterium]